MKLDLLGLHSDSHSNRGQREAQGRDDELFVAIQELNKPRSFGSQVLITMETRYLART